MSVSPSFWQGPNAQNVSFENWWPIYIINSVDNTKVPCYTLPPTQHYSFFTNLPPFMSIVWLLVHKLCLSSHFRISSCSQLYIYQGMDVHEKFGLKINRGRGHPVMFVTIDICTQSIHTQNWTICWLIHIHLIQWQLKLRGLLRKPQINPHQIKSFTLKQ